MMLRKAILGANCWGLRPANSFDNQVLGILRDQATRINLEYATPPGTKK